MTLAWLGSLAAITGGETISQKAYAPNVGPHNHSRSTIVIDLPAVDWVASQGPMRGVRCANSAVEETDQARPP